MSSATLAPPDPAAVTPPPKARPQSADADEPLYGRFAGLWRFTVADYERMITAGILPDDTPVELLSGFVVKKLSLGFAHNHAVHVLTLRLARMLPDGWCLGPATTAQMGDDSLPEPDFTILRGEAEAFATRRATAADIPLVIEVSDSSLRRDQREKLAIYAASGVLVCWIVNIPDRRVEVYTEPGNGHFARQTHFVPGQDVTLTLDGVAVGSVSAASLFLPEAA